MSANNKIITVAVIGMGLMGPRHADAVVKEPNTKLVALVDPAPQTQDLATKYGVSYFATIGELLASQQKPEAAVICTPNHVHAVCAEELAAAGVHILVEKPLCTDAQTGKDLVVHLKEIAARTGVKSLVGHHRRFNPFSLATREATTSGSLGHITAVNGLWTVFKPAPYFEAGQWRKTKTGGPILINLIHDVDLLHYFLGPIVRVQTEKTVSRRGFEAEEGAAIIFKFGSGTIGTFLLCDNVVSPFGWEFGTGESPWFPHTGQDFYRFFGTDASLSVPDMTRWSYTGTKSWMEKITGEKIPVGTGEPIENQLAHFVRVIRGEEQPRCTLDAGLAALIVCEAVKESLERGTAVDIEPYEL
ncbi:NAD(P)-binding protein [Coniochaeta ligniaria NRRL 30616]|uniref:NAD(P)-binding protein n=1 Tax=Coniochaeta ligniaria NRRL 30616 TaxID=1408157 RepID=A0A1J7JY22_9PEZI|nr:NAD(P)-binding protein [Coniochaeta ligniaria NRRL 30616]